MIEAINDPETAFRFDPVNNPDDHKLLSSMTLRGNMDPRLQDASWLVSMRQCVGIASQDIGQAETQFQVEAVQEARQQFKYEIGADDTSHPLHTTFTRRAQIPAPTQLLETLTTLNEITGDGIRAAHSTSGTLGVMPASQIRQRLAIMERLGHTLGWQGDVLQLLGEKPYLLKTNTAVWFMLARLAARHGTADDAQLSVKDVGKLLTHAPEAHMLAAVSSDTYHFSDHIPMKKMAAIGVPAARSQVHNALANTAVLERVGKGVARAYKRYRPDGASSPPEKIPGKQYVTGDEPWLRTVLESKEMSPATLAAELNAVIATGAQSLLRHRRDSPKYNTIVEARVKLLQTLNMLDPESKTYKEFEVYRRNQPSLFNSETFIVMCRCLVEHDIQDPLGAIQNSFKVLYSPNTLEAKLEAIEDCDLDPETALHYHPRLLKEDPERIKAILQSMRTAVRAKAVEKVQQMDLHIPATLQDTKAPGKAFDPLRFRQDFALLYLVTQDTGKLADDFWFSRMKSYVEGIPKKIHMHMTPKEQANIQDMKRCFAQELGLNDPNHPLAPAYAQKGTTGMAPRLMLDTLQALQELTGNALTAVMQDRQLLFIEAGTLFRRFRYMQKVTSMLGWQGDAAELIRTYPGVLRYGDKRKAVVAHLARQHGTPEDARLDGSHIAAALVARPEAHLMALLDNPSYRFGDKMSSDELGKTGTLRARERIYAAITIPEGIARLGRGVVKAYLLFSSAGKRQSSA